MRHGLAAARARRKALFLALAAKNRAAKEAAQLQRQANQFQARALVRRALREGLEAKLQRLGHDARQRAIFHADALKPRAALALGHVLRQLKQTLGHGHFVHGQG